jgi:hypothetical protein
MQKQIIVCLIITLIALNSYGQDLTSKTIPELIEIQKNAITDENYDLAEKIKLHLEILEVNKEKIVQLEKEKQTALIIEDYDKVILLDKKIESLKTGDPLVDLNTNKVINSKKSSDNELLCNGVWKLTSSNTVLARNKKPFKTFNRNLPCIMDNTVVFNNDRTFIVSPGINKCKAKESLISGNWQWTDKTSITTSLSNLSSSFSLQFKGFSGVGFQRQKKNRSPNRKVLKVSENILTLETTIYDLNKPRFVTTETFIH